MTDLRRNFSRGTAAAAVALILLAFPVAALAAVDIDPGTTASDLAAEGGNILEECELTATETCEVEIKEADNEVGALVDVTEDGSGIASGEVFTEFNITGEEGALVGSFLSTVVNVSGVLSALGPEALASVEASLQVWDTTDGVLIAAETVVNEKIADGKIPVAEKSVVAMSLPLNRGHSYRVSLILEAGAVAGVGGVGDVGSALSDFLDTASWSDLSVTAGVDPFALIVIIDARLDQLETDVDALEEQVEGIAEDLEELDEKVDGIAEDLEELDEKVEELRDDFDSHSHTYRTGKGTGHNNTEAETGAALVPEVGPVDDPGDVDGDGDGVASVGDLCPGTPEGAEVDASGCELAAFCSLQERSSICSKADWQGDESRNPRDCRWRRGACEAR
jgi:outer membrane murein-binding lipoprotein Lpp